MAQDTSNPFGKINHIVVIYTENRSFDSLFGYFPGADGIEQARGKAKEQAISPQVDTDGTPLALLPRVAVRMTRYTVNARSAAKAASAKMGSIPAFRLNF